METKGEYFFVISLSFIFLSTCTDVKQGVSTVDLKKDSLAAVHRGEETDISTLDTIIAIFSDETLNGTEEEQPTERFTAAYLDSTANALYLYRIDSSRENPYGFEENELVSYPDSVYRKRFASISSAITMDYNRHVENFIDLYGIRKKELTERMFGKSILYYPYIEQVLMEKGLPHELKYLTMVESALQANARSHMAAVGLWQIRYRTGKWLGMEINDFVDERRDPYASTKAAIDYLDRLHTTYGNWQLALAAYNSGPGNVNKAIVRAGGSHDFWRVRRYLPVETRSYVPAFLAIVYLSRYQDEHNIRPVQPDLPFQAVDTVRIYQEIYFAELADELQMEEEDLVFLNPSLIRGVVPATKEGTSLVIPLDRIASFEEKRADLLNSARQEVVASSAQVMTKVQEIVPENDDMKLIEHRVRRGQTIGGISDRYDVSIDKIRDWNGMRNNIIRVGQTLKIYVPASRYGR
jgi:membrane-bound lytic murein transglycosylase D